MIWLGNPQGPSKDDVLSRYYPIDCHFSARDGYLSDIAVGRKSSFVNRVEPVLLDEEGRPYKEFGATDGRVFPHYLNQALAGDILVSVLGCSRCFMVGKQGVAAVLHWGDAKSWIRVTPEFSRQSLGRRRKPVQLTLVGKPPLGIAIAHQVSFYRWSV